MVFVAYLVSLIIYNPQVIYANNDYETNDLNRSHVTDNEDANDNFSEDVNKLKIKDLQVSDSDKYSEPVSDVQENNEIYESEDEDLNNEELNSKQKVDKSKKEKEHSEELFSNDKVDTTKDLHAQSLLYSIGDRGDHILSLKRQLVQLGFANWDPPTNVYGTITAGVVRDFQEYYGLPITGIADEATRDKVDEILSFPYRDGDRGSAIVKMKEKLVQLGFASWSRPSQFYGPVTITAVNKFQEYYGFDQSASFTQEMSDKMDSLLKGEYSIGDSGAHIVSLKEDLVNLGFANWSNPSNSYGSITANVVKDFQIYYDLPASGIADEITREKITNVLNPPYHNGDRGKGIIELKEKLVLLGFASWEDPSQYFGSHTITVLNRFQNYYGLEITESASQDLIDKIDRLLTGKYSNGDKGDHIVAFKEDLVHLGFASWTSPSNIYGPITSNVVKRVQNYYDLPISGIADQYTLETVKHEIENNVPRFDKGDSGEHIVELKKKLVQLGFASWSKPTRFYGKNTIAAVNRFQSYYGLPITNRATPDTIDKVEEILSSGYNIGDSGSHIKELKSNLVILGFASWTNPTRVFGDVTSNVLKRFQAAHGLIVNGIADEVTLEKIDNSIVKVFIDPGHGGKDPGGQGYGLDEKDVVLDIALKTANVLSRDYLGVNVRLSRTDDSYYELIDRANMANEWEADYYISLHTNAHNGRAHGFESFIFNGKISNETIRRQKDIHSYLINRIEVLNRGMKRANFSVLRNTRMPALLIEYMFIDNRAENSLLTNASYRTSLANYTAEAIAQSFNLQRR